MASKYGPIEFAEGYNKSFADFKKEFGNVWVFKNMLPKKREAEMKKAFKIATDGKLPRSTEKSKKSNTSKNK